jgi:hypothetical protein
MVFGSVICLFFVNDLVLVRFFHVCNPSHGAGGIWVSWVSCTLALLLVEDLDC